MDWNLKFEIMVGPKTFETGDKTIGNKWLTGKVTERPIFRMVDELYYLNYVSFFILHVLFLLAGTTRSAWWPCSLEPSKKFPSFTPTVTFLPTFPFLFVSLYPHYSQFYRYTSLIFLIFWHFFSSSYFYKFYIIFLIQSIFSHTKLWVFSLYLYLSLFLPFFWWIFVLSYILLKVDGSFFFLFSF